MAFLGDTSGAVKRSDDSSTSGHAAASKIVQSVQDDANDVVDLWNKALRAYNNVVGFELTMRAANVEGLVALAVEEMNKFHRFRHDGAKVDRLRSRFSEALELLEEGAKQLAATASSAFPPAAVIGTAVTWMLRACREVSETYDTVEFFFDDMISFLQQLAILEKRLPKEKVYRNCLMDVFVSILRVCGFATVFIRNGRFRKWIANLRQGDDSELGKARKDMDLKMKRLRDAARSAILGNVEDMKRMSNELKRNSEARQQMLEHHTSLLQNIRAGQDDIKNEIAKLLNALQSPQKDTSTTRQAKATGKAAGQSKAASASRIRSALRRVEGDIAEYHIIKDTIVDGTCTWLFSQTEWLAWVAEGDEGSSDTSPKLLAIAGDLGCGKSHIATVIYDHLRERVEEPERRLCAAHFYFREQNPNLDNVYNAVITVINQVAEQSPALCERIYAQLVRDEVTAYHYDWRGLLDNLLEPCFEAETRYRLFLLLDGIDELDDVERIQLGEFWKAVIERGLRISLIVTLRPDKISRTDDLTSFPGCRIIHISRELQKSDIAAVVRHHLGNLASLKRFSPFLKQQISEKLEATAPNLLYAHHMLRRFNAIGREGAVLAQLRQSLPQTLSDLYEAMLTACMRRTVSKYHNVVGVLFCWLSFSFRRLILDEVVSLLRHVSGDATFELDDIPEPMALFVRIGDPAHGSELVQTSEIDYLLTGNVSSDPVLLDGRLPVNFHQRAMQSFFCKSAANTGSEASRQLLISQSEAHRRIFLAASRMCRLAPEGSAAMLNSGLTDYATYYLMDHWMQIDIDQHSPEQRAEIMETLASVLSNEYGYATRAQRVGIDYGTDFSNVFLERIGIWAKMTGESGMCSLTPGAISWWQRVAVQPEKGLLGLAKGHLQDLYQAQSAREALGACECAIAALLQSGYSNELREQTFANFSRFSGSSGPADEQAIIAEDDYILGLIGLFDDVPMTTTAYWAITSVVLLKGYSSPAVVICETALALEPAAAETFRLLYLAAQADFNIGRTQEAARMISECLNWPDTGDIPECFQREAHITRARIEARLGNHSEVMAAFSRARALDNGSLLDMRILDEEFAFRRDAGDYHGVVDVLRRWTPIERFAWLALDYGGGARHWGLLEAAASAGQQEYLVEVYKAAISELDKFASAAPLRCDLASAHLLVRGNAADARVVLDEVLDSLSDGRAYKFTYEDPRTVLVRAVNLQSRALLDLFVSSRDPAVKGSLLEALRGLMTRPLATCVPSFSATDTLYHEITLARMTLQMGPRVDFQKHLQRVISVCFDSLEDGVVWNDSPSLRLLSQALAHLHKAVGGTRLLRAARILMSAFFSDLDPAENGDGADGLEKRMENTGRSGDDEGELQENGIGVMSTLLIGNTESHDGQEKPTEGAGSSGDGEAASTEHELDAVAATPTPCTDEGNLSDSIFWCGGTFCKGETFHKGWHGRSLYLCIDCDTTGLCQACYDALQAGNDGTAPFQGRRFCGRGHRHIKAPIEGWRGVKDRVLRIEGDEDVPFKEFLRSVREDICTEAWAKFWED